MARALKNRFRQSKSKRSTVNSFAFLQQIPEFLVFVFFALTPLVFFSGLDPEGYPFFTLYDLPKLYFIAAFAFLLAGFYFWSLAKDSLGASALVRFLLSCSGGKLLFLWFLILFFSCFQALVQPAAFFSLFYYLVLLVLYVVLAQFFSRSSRRWAAVYGLIASLFIFVPMGILQFIGFQVPLLKPILGPASTFGYRNPAAHFIAMTLPFALFALWRHWRFWRVQGGSLQLSLFSSLLVLALAASALLFMNYSRTAILALLVGMLVLPFFLIVPKKDGASGFGWNRQNVGRALTGSILMVVVVLVLILSFPESRERAERSYAKFKRGGIVQLLEFRYYHWSNTLIMVKENPVIGVGLGNWRFIYPLYYKSFARDPLFNYQTQVRKAHNDYLQLAAECGIPALCLFLLLWGRQFYLLRYATVESDDGEDWRFPLLASLLAFSVIMFFSFPMQMAYSRMFCFFLLALGEARAWPALSS